MLLIVLRALTAIVLVAVWINFSVGVLDTNDNPLDATFFFRTLVAFAFVFVCAWPWKGVTFFHGKRDGKNG